MPRDWGDDPDDARSGTDVLRMYDVFFFVLAGTAILILGAFVSRSGCAHPRQLHGSYTAEQSGVATPHPHLSKPNSLTLTPGTPGTLTLIPLPLYATATTTVPLPLPHYYHYTTTALPVDYHHNNSTTMSMSMSMSTA